MQSIKTRQFACSFVDVPSSDIKNVYFVHCPWQSVFAFCVDAGEAAGSSSPSASRGQERRPCPPFVSPDPLECPRGRCNIYLPRCTQTHCLLTRYKTILLSSPTRRYASISTVKNRIRQSIAMNFDVLLLRNDFILWYRLRLNDDSVLIIINFALLRCSRPVLPCRQKLIRNSFPFTPPPLIKHYVYVRGRTTPYNNAVCMSQPVRKKKKRQNATPLNDVVCSLSMAGEKHNWSGGAFGTGFLVRFVVNMQCKPVRRFTT